MSAQPPNDPPSSSQSSASDELPGGAALDALLTLGSREIASELTLGLLHKLNNVMTSIYFSMDAGQTALEPEHPAMAAFNSIGETIHEAQLLVRRTADLNLPPAPEAAYLELDDFCRTNLDLLKILLPKNVVFEFHPASEPCYIKAAPEELREAILHLCMSIRQRTRSGLRVDLSVRMLPAEDGQSAARAVLELRDSGHAISDPLDIFPAVTEIRRLSDLGMSRALHLIQKQNGTVQCSTTESQETLFTIALPRVE